MSQLFAYCPDPASLDDPSIGTNARGDISRAEPTISCADSKKNESSQSLDEIIDDSRARRTVQYRDRLVPIAGSCARDFLANDRTFFSWLRLSTSIFMLGALVCIDFKSRIFDLNVPREQALIDRIAGVIIMALSAITIVLAIFRYARVVALLANFRQQLPERVALHWAYAGLGASIVMAAVTGLTWRDSCHGVCGTGL
ncbi:hypothetical protein THASP1DRAFT_28869 [Thamnocephalis sphaerospora]|uniref:DUF202 domain-containing protein n=1 Tax=Thamnocephalis sphaerospora TaxID=78915 RepID=A0A4P9XT52_9FUNG|nr:hypothetical protein THASP1DRAFT_28869 [Thamnocephalis sphaerospora]|eukprot:RKP09345.1 hypothetical protein THASP1DRAFT_28869 [Thamnocephalis sphaerospora]